MVMVETQVGYAVVGDIRRLDRAVPLADRLEAPLALDTVNKPNANHDRAWGMYTDTDDWLVVLEDDVQPVDNFKNHVQQAIQHVPDIGVLSFYTGYPRPERFRVSQAVLRAELTRSSFLKHDKLLWGPAVAMRVDMIDDMLEWVSRSDEPYDQRMSLWMKARGYPAYYTMPSLVEHSDIPSLLGRGGVPRKAFWFSQPRYWNSKVIEF